MMTAMMSPPETEALLFSGVWFLPLQAVSDPELETVPGSTDQRHAVTMCVHMNALRVMDDVNRGKGCNVHQHSWINGGWFHLTVQAGGLQLCIIALSLWDLWKILELCATHSIYCLPQEKRGHKLLFYCQTFGFGFWGTQRRTFFHEGTPY